MIDVRLLNLFFFSFKFSDKPNYCEMILVDRINRLLRANALAAPYLIEVISTQLIFLIAGRTDVMDYLLIAGKWNTD